MSAELGTFNTIFFDAAGTLFELREPVGEGYANVGKEFGLELCPDATEAAFRAHFRSMPNPYPSTHPDPERDWWSKLVDRVLTELEAPTPEGFFERLWDHYSLPAVWQLFPEVSDVLRDLRDGNRHLVMVTNFDERIFPIIDGLGLREFFQDNVVTSASARSRKPDPAIFLKAKTFAKPGPILHVGDERVADWEGARKSGITAFELCRPEKTLLDLPLF